MNPFTFHVTKEVGFALPDTFARFVLVPLGLFGLQFASMVNREQRCNGTQVDGAKQKCARNDKTVRVRPVEHCTMLS